MTKQRSKQTITKDKYDELNVKDDRFSAQFCWRFFLKPWYEFSGVTSKARLSLRPLKGSQFGSHSASASGWGGLGGWGGTRLPAGEGQASPRGVGGPAKVKGQRLPRLSSSSLRNQWRCGWQEAVSVTPLPPPTAVLQWQHKVIQWKL